MKLYPEYIPAMKELRKYYIKLIKAAEEGRLHEDDWRTLHSCPLCEIDDRMRTLIDAKCCSTCPWVIFTKIECSLYAEVRRRTFGKISHGLSYVSGLRNYSPKWAKHRIGQLTRWIKKYEEANR